MFESAGADRFPVLAGLPPVHLHQIELFPDDQQGGQMSAPQGLPGSQAGFSWRPGDRSTTRTRGTVEKVLTTDPLSVIALQHVRDLLVECVRQDVPIDEEVTIELSGTEAEPKYALRVTGSTVRHRVIRLGRTSVGAGGPREDGARWAAPCGPVDYSVVWNEPLIPARRSFRAIRSTSTGTKSRIGRPVNSS